MRAITRLLRRPAGIAPLCVAATLALAMEAAQAAPPVPVSGLTADAAPVTLGFDAAGRAVVTWRGLSEAGPDTLAPFASFASTRLDGTWRAPQTIGSTVVAHDMAIAGPRRAAIVAWLQRPLSRNRSRSVITLTLLDTVSGRTRRAATLDQGPPRRNTYEGPQPSLLSPTPGATRGGGLIIAWARSFPRALAGVWVTTMSPRGRLAKPRRLGPFGSQPVVATSSDGHGLLAWQRGHRVLTRIRSPRGSWGPIEVAAARRWAQIEYLSAAGVGSEFALGMLQTLRSGAGVWSQASVHVRVPGAGWRHGTLGEFNFAPAGETAFVTDHLRVLAFATSDGRLHAAWPALMDGRVRALTAALVPGAQSVGFDPPAVLSPATTNIALEEAAAGPAGAFAVTWFDLAGGRGGVGLAEIDSSGAARTEAGPATGRVLFGTQVAYSPRTGRPTVVWSEGDSPQGYRIVAWASP